MYEPKFSDTKAVGEMKRIVYNIKATIQLRSLRGMFIKLCYMFWMMRAFKGF